MQTSKETVVAIPSGLSRSFAWLLHAAGCWEEPTIPLHSLHMAMYPIWAYLWPCNHRKACRETKWMIRDRAPPANSKQNCVSVQASLSGTSCMLWDGKWATTHDSTIFGLEVRPYFPPGSTLVLDTDCFLQCCKALLVFKQQEVHPNSSGSTADSLVSRGVHFKPRKTKTCKKSDLQPFAGKPSIMYRHRYQV